MQGRLLRITGSYFSVGQRSIKSYFKHGPQKRKRQDPAPPPKKTHSPEINQKPTQDYSLNSNPLPLSSEFYHPVYDSPFKHNQPVPFSFLVQTFEEVAQAKGQNSKQLQKQALANFFRSVIVLRPDHLVKCFYLCIGKLCPDYRGVEMGVGKEALYKAVAKVTGETSKQIKEYENQIGDLGNVVLNARLKQKDISSFFARKSGTSSHTVSGVYDSFWRIATLKGTKSVSLKEEELLRLLKNATSQEAKYIVRILQRSLKIGASELTMQSSLAVAVAMTPPKQEAFPPVVKAEGAEEATKEISKALKRSINECPDYDKIIRTLLEVGPDGKSISYILERCKLTPGIPVNLMLAQPSRGIQEILDRFTDVEFTCEFKYDGMRAQIHILDDRSVKVFSRGNEDITEMYPDIIHFLGEHIDYEQVRNCVIDSELVAFDLETNRIRPFQDIQQRGRKKVHLSSIEVEVCIYPFDILYYNDESLLELSLHHRRQYLKKAIKEEQGKIQFVHYQNLSQFEDIEAFLLESVKIGCEGLIVKTLHSNATYEPSKRSLNWLKLKKDYIYSSETRLSDTVDLVPIGAYYGTGKRTGVYGSFLFAIYDPLNDEYQTVCRTATGFSEDQLKSLHSTLKQYEIPKPYDNYKVLHTDLDVWFKPKIVCEVLGADLSVSPKHTSAWGKVAEEKGLALRFPRFLKLRNDKSPQNATDPQQILQMYFSQSSIVT